MSAVPKSDGEDRRGNVRSVEEMKELAALSRLIGYARCAAEDVELVGAMHWLELAMQAVNREILASPNVEMIAPYLDTTTDRRNTH
ncbi:hypothetical protein [Rhizobium sp. 2MFCol3.1]|uniref:hypothetical protein n=1 Tax=Rhizobium sp. 2MFCol3.1 TaxID=1246459 RepID=UPI0004770453|nr:hypothetical protein [Rhizobium sp. 2MFCol3.1]